MTDLLYKQVLENTKKIVMNNRIGHAYLIYGSQLPIQEMAAKNLAHSILCLEKKYEHPCGNCISCRLFKESSHPDYYEVRVEEKLIGVDEIRKMQEDIIIKPAYSDYKVYYISQSDIMTIQSQNALLRILENPPGYSVIILSTVKPSSLNNTVLSRVVKIPLRVDLYSSAIEIIQSFPDYEIIIQIVLSLKERTNLFEGYGFFEKNKNNINDILDIMMFFYRDLLLVKTGGSEKRLINSGKKDIIINNSDLFSEGELFDNIKLINGVKKNLKYNINFSLAMEVMLIKLSGG